jgi:plasmid stabilization system protein ParE
MNAPFRLTPQATEDLDAIWWFMAARSRDAADRVESEIVAACRRLAKGRHATLGALLDGHEISHLRNRLPA